jgi:uncharacterized protein (DUF2267 family)
MATTGLEVFDRTLHTTNVWLDEINAQIGPDRHLAWHVLGTVLRSIRDEMLVEQSAHFAAQLPLLVRGAYFDQYRPAAQPASARSQEDFIARIQHDLEGARPVKAENAAAAVMRTLNRHVTEGQIKKVRDSLPKGVRAMWPEPGHKEPEHAGHDGKEKSHESAKAAEPSRSAGQPAQPPSSGQHAAPQPSAPPQHAAPQPSAPPRPAPQPSAPPQHAAPQPSAPQHAVPPQPSAPQRPAPQPSAPQHAAPQPSAPQRPAPQPSAPQHTAPQPPTPQHAAPQPAPSRPAPQHAEPPRPASHHPEPRHAPPQRAAHPARGEQEEIVEEIVEEIIEEFDDGEEEIPSTSKSKSSKSAHVPIGASSRPAAKVDAAPGAGRTTTTGRKKTGKKSPHE